MTIHEQFIHHGKNIKESMRKAKLLLPEIEEKKIWKKKGYTSIYEYAAKLANMSQWQVNDALRILRKIKSMPALRKVAEEKGLGAVRPVVTIANLETEEFWANKASELSKHALTAFVSEKRRANRLENGLGPKSRPEKIEVRVKLRPDLVERLKKLGDINKLMEKFLESTENNTEIEKPSIPPPVKTRSRSIPSKIKQHVIDRTNGYCAFPGCTKSYEILHHTQRWALERIHDANRLHPLCKNHERLAHHGLIKNEVMAPSEWLIRNEADKTDPKFFIDQMVALYRSG